MGMTATREQERAQGHYNQKYGCFFHGQHLTFKDILLHLSQKIKDGEKFIPLSRNFT
jgi:hypothetical protein